MGVWHPNLMIFYIDLALLCSRVLSNLKSFSGLTALGCCVSSNCGQEGLWNFICWVSCVLSWIRLMPRSLHCWSTAIYPMWGILEDHLQVSTCAECSSMGRDGHASVCPFNPSALWPAQVASLIPDSIQGADCYLNSSTWHGPGFLRKHFPLSSRVFALIMQSSKVGMLQFLQLNNVINRDSGSVPSL